MFWSRDLHRCLGTTANAGHALLESVVSGSGIVLTLLDFRKRIDWRFDFVSLE